MDLEQRIAELTAATLAVNETAKAKLLNTRAPSIASRVGPGPRLDGYRPSADTVPVHPALKASLGGNYQSGAFITAVANARSRDAEEQAHGKATLAELGLFFMDIPDGSSNKATLGATGATGGYVLPNSLVERVEKPEVGEALFTSGPSPLLTVRTGVAVRAVDLPYRTGAPARMEFQDWGQTKQNVDEQYGTYSASLGTMARIYDIGKQYLRFSAGSAEQDVIDELTKARDLGETYYVLAGAGTGTGSTGDPTTGIYTALLSGSGTYRTAHTAASNSTIAGSAAKGITTALSALASRSRRASAIVTDSTTYWTILSQGSDTAGFWLDPRASGGFTIDASGQLRLWGVPLLHHPNFDSYTGTSKAAIAADFRAFKFYRGLEFRIDSSDQAGTRWDLNLVGLRGEQEIGFSASTGVSVGCAQLITALIP